MLDYDPRNKKNCMLVKVDFRKTYYCISWDYLRYGMKRMSFNAKWMQWMEGLVFNSSMSVCVNERPT